MELIKLLEDSLRRNGFDGLYNPGVCACKLDDLCPCGEPNLVCEGGVLCTGDDDYCENCEGTEKCDFHIGPKPRRSAYAGKECEGSMRDNKLWGLAHEIWAASQLMPNEGIEDGVSRVYDTLEDGDIFWEAE